MSVTVVAVSYASPGAPATGPLTLSGAPSSVGGNVNLSYNADEIITVVATHDNLGLQGSQTMRGGTGGAVGSGVLISRGIEFYDVDHNGFLDRCTIFFDQEIRDAGEDGLSDYDGFRVGGATNVFAAGTVPMINMDNGGAGVRNAGPFGVTLFLKDGMYGTDEIPQVTYASFEDTGTPVQYAFDTDPRSPAVRQPWVPAMRAMLLSLTKPTRTSTTSRQARRRRWTRRARCSSAPRRGIRTTTGRSTSTN